MPSLRPYRSDLSNLSLLPPPRRRPGAQDPGVLLPPSLFTSVDETLFTKLVGFDFGVFKLTGKCCVLQYRPGRRLHSSLQSHPEATVRFLSPLHGVDFTDSTLEISAEIHFLCLGSRKHIVKPSKSGLIHKHIVKHIERSCRVFILVPCIFGALVPVQVRTNTQTYREGNPYIVKHIRGPVKPLISVCSFLLEQRTF
jgi:hypothetical protein